MHAACSLGFRILGSGLRVWGVVYKVLLVVGFGRSEGQGWTGNDA